MMTMGGDSGGGKRFKRSAGGLQTEINITPFVDVMLVLLIIFMVTTPMMQSGVDINLPKEDAGSMETKDENIVSLRYDGVILYNDKQKTIDELEMILSDVAKRTPDANVYLRADQTIDYGRVMAVMAAIRRAGVVKLGMVTEMPADSATKQKAK